MATDLQLAPKLNRTRFQLVLDNNAYLIYNKIVVSFGTKAQLEFSFE
jgi:hypothetical protein